MQMFYICIVFGNNDFSGLICLRTSFNSLFNESYHVKMNILLAEDRNQISDVWLSCSLKKKVSTEIQKMAVMFSLSLSL